MYPYFYYQDEIRHAEMSLKVIREKTLEPDFYLYPHFPVYFNSVFYFGMFAARNAGQVISQMSLAPVITAAKNFDASSWESIYFERCISMALGLLCVFGVWLMARLFLSEMFALIACLIFALLPLPLTLSVIGKNDIYQECFVIYSFYFLFRLIVNGKVRDYILAAIFAGICFDSKLNYLPLVFLPVATLVRAANENRSIPQWFWDRRTWLAGGASVLSLFVFSPYYFFNIRKGLQMVGWVYWISAFNSYSHIDYHHWWLDRYGYGMVVILPFLAGLPVYFSALAGFLERTIRIRINVWFVMLANFGVFYYGYLAGSEGTFPPYTFMHLMPFFPVLAAWPLQLLWQKEWKKSSLACSLILIVCAFLNAQSYYAVNFAAFDEIGPRLVKEIPAGAKILGYSVYQPGPALAAFDYKRAWPQNLDRAAVNEFNPDYILVYRSDFSGFEKFYRDTHPVNGRLKELLSGKWGYHEADRLEVSYFCDSIFKWLDPEFMIELILLEKNN